MEMKHYDIGILAVRDKVAANRRVILRTDLQRNIALLKTPTLPPTYPRVDLILSMEA
jgi:hypothetical protein